MLNVAFLWHFHQPCYWDPIRGKESMPWVRLHSIKGYSDMADALEKHPKVKGNVNIVPSLLDRWALLSKKGFQDEYFQMASIDAAELKPEDKEFLLLRFFQANWDTMIHPYTRYHQLLVKRGHRLTPGKLSAAVESFTTDDFRDLQVWFDLSWFGYSAAERHGEIRDLRRHDRGFTEEDKLTVWKLQQQVISELIPRYRRLWESGQVEITASPYYHPILPLLIDSSCARQGLPREPMPIEHFQAPEDARVQLERAAQKVQELLGRRPLGLWPSEGSVSKEAMQLAAESGFHWAASDEAILFLTLGQQRDTGQLYQPYQLETEPPIAMVFRDHGLSDAIGFRYSRVPAAPAAQEFLAHLNSIERASKKEKTVSLVSVILDGENPWEYFPDGGKAFLTQLYSGLESHASLTTVTVAQYLANNPPKARLKSLFPGSWIDGNFRVWIGDKEKNQAWDLLARTRRVLTEVETVPGISQGNPPFVPPCNSRGEVGEAWEALYRAEGSDWFWWFGDIYNSDNDAEFDRLFRNNLREIYRSLGKDIPAELDRPIGRMPGMERRSQPAFTMTPVLDGKVTSYYEWLGACKFDVCRAGGTMSLPDARVQKIFYGFDDDFLYLRMDIRKEMLPDLQMIRILFDHAPQLRIEIARDGNSQDNRNPRLFVKKSKGDWEDGGSTGQFAWNDILEVKIPFEVMGAHPGQELGFYVLVLQGDAVVERWPLDGVIQFILPKPEDQAKYWFV